jgi:hypothetical protein
MNFILKTIPHTLSMSSKRKVPPNDDDDVSSLILGRLIKAYSIADAVRVASH